MLHTHDTPIDVDAIRDDVNAMVTTNPGGREHAGVLGAILENLAALDFHQAAKVDPSKTVPLKTQIVLAVAEVLSVARNLNYGLCRKDAFIYTYNGEFWQLLNRDDLEDFLGESALRLMADFGRKSFEFYSVNGCSSGFNSS